MAETIIDRIQQRLRDLNISEAKASVDAGLSIDTLRGLRLRGGIPRGDTLEKLAKVLKVSPGWLLTGEDDARLAEQASISQIGGKHISDGLLPGFIPEIDTVLGAGGDGYPVPAVITDKSRIYDADAVVAQWYLPESFVRNVLNLDPLYIDIITVRGDSMESPNGEGFRDGDRVLVNRKDTMFRQGGVYAIRDDLETIIKQIQLVRGGNPEDTPRIKCTSLNPRYDPFELTLDGSADVIGRIVWKMTRV